MTTTAPVSSLRNQAGHFVKGRSGNPSGRGKGNRCLTARALDALAESDVRKVLRAVLAKAKDGDLQAARLVLDRAWAVPRGRPLDVDIPKIAAAGDTAKAANAIARAVADGRIGAEDARDLAAMIESVRKAHDLADLAERVEMLEEDVKFNAKVNARAAQENRAPRADDGPWPEDDHDQHESGHHHG